jgi:hypothetical protein
MGSKERRISRSSRRGYHRSGNAQGRYSTDFTDELRRLKKAYGALETARTEVGRAVPVSGLAIRKRMIGSRPVYEVIHESSGLAIDQYDFATFDRLKDAKAVLTAVAPLGPWTLSADDFANYAGTEEGRKLRPRLRAAIKAALPGKGWQPWQ